MTARFDVQWHDHGRTAKERPDPAYPNGIDVGGARPGEPSCKGDLPYPAPRCGIHVVRCKLCGMTAAITAAGRPDDPRSVTLPCKPMGTA